MKQAVSRNCAARVLAMRNTRARASNLSVDCRHDPSGAMRSVQDYSGINAQ